MLEPLRKKLLKGRNGIRSIWTNAVMLLAFLFYRKLEACIFFYQKGMLSFVRIQSAFEFAQERCCSDPQKIG